ncbi:type VII secretion integral membrane protein EccD [Nocardioides sp. AE5]|uniref:type VII secretion integral membrane protein EccD n=1 Tax=Nocardioides sp. AE5 TaxID=2962573 RepID=UPI002881FD7D|nr:type VII secretion integral membrane protein EccD [Nocardioides sp. AE5]MDT0200503.1 type VII secretion integral membrane protein EccD [Nocardioides sp. AE5]
MSQAATPASTSGLVRVTVASGARRVDLVLPGSVPVAELVPELARSVGLLDAATVHAGYRVITGDGRRLTGDAGLTIQGVEDGGLLTVAAGVDEEQPRVYDDVVEAMADAVERDLAPWQPAAGRRTALVAAGLFLVLGAAALLLQRGTTLAGVAASAIAVLLVVGAIVLGHVQREREASLCLAWLGAAYGATAGVLLTHQVDSAGLVLAATGAGAAAAGVLALVGLLDGRALVLPTIVVGAVLGAVGLLVHATEVEIAPTLAVVLVAVVIVGSVLPWLALAFTRTRVEQLHSAADIDRAPAPIEAEAVRRDATVGHEILLGVTATVGTLLVLVAPWVVSLGLAGAQLCVAASVVVMLRTRQYRSGSEVLAGLLAGVLALVSTAAAVLVLHPDWRPGLAVALAATGAVLLVATALPNPVSVRRSRLGDLVETAALVALVPLLLVAVGLFARLGG